MLARETLAALTALLLAGLGWPGCSDSDSDSGCEEHSDCDQAERCLDGSCETSAPPCDSEPAPTCDPQTPEAECLALGGDWMFGAEICNCPTGDAGCPCWSQAHCQGECLGAFQWSQCGVGYQIGECSAITTVFGCHCEVREHLGGDQVFTFSCRD